eukprot:CCRYP_019191-RD/>CCRYP_019191-RD protein AED:0.06 eAED:0.06 QI:216/1/1/1/1/1/5/27/582
MNVSIDDYRIDYVGPDYVITPQVSTFHRISRWGRSSDITDLLSTDQDAQASYAAGLMVMAVFSFTFFAFWAIAVLTLKCMGDNGGLFSGAPFTARSVGTLGTTNRQQSAVRLLFVVATLILWISAVLLLVMGVTELDKTANAADNTLVKLRDKIEAAEDITESIQDVGTRSVKIRDKVVYLFDTVICDAIDTEDTLGVNFNDLKTTARDDLNQLSSFLYESLDALLAGIDTANALTTSAEDVVSEIRLGGWPAILVAGFLFILPSFFVVGVSFAFANLTAKRFQLYMSYVILPMFICVVGFCIIVCCILIPMAAMNADFCTGSSSAGGPDDTVLTSYRNLLGNDQSTRFLVVAYYTQRCISNYYPYDFLGKYFNKLGMAQISIDALIKALSDNLGVIQNQCGTNDGELFLSLAQSMKSNLNLLKGTVFDALELVNCKDINDLYVNAMHRATCTHAPATLGWMYGTLLGISVSGMCMITLRAAYLPTDNKASATKVIKHASISSPTHHSKLSSQITEESLQKFQKQYHCAENREHFSNEHSDVMVNMNLTTENSMPFALPSIPQLNFDFVVMTPEEQDDVSAL